MLARYAGEDAAWNPIDAHFEVMMDVEEALLDKLTLLVALLDYSKYFDRFVWALTWRLLLQLGAPRELAALLEAFYVRLKRAFKLGRHFGEWWLSTNSVAQGCALSLIVANALITVWTRLIHRDAPQVCTTGYVDDRTIRSKQRNQFIRALESTARFDARTGHIMNVDKSNAASTTEAGRAWLRKLRIDGRRLRYTIAAKLLGAQFSTARYRVTQLSQQRADTARATLQRARFSLLPLRHKRMVIANKAFKQAQYGSYLVGLPERALCKLRKEADSAQNGQYRRMKARELYYTMVRPGHKEKPAMADAYTTLTTGRRVLARRPDLHDQAQRILTKIDDQRGAVLSCNGPIHRLREVLASLRAHLSPDLRITRPRGRDFGLCEQEAGWCEHQFRNMIREVEWQRLSSRCVADAPEVRRRKDLEDIPAELDRAATMALLSGGRDRCHHLLREAVTDSLDHRTLESIVSGAIWTRDRQARAHLKDVDGSGITSNICAHCGRATEDHLHMYWRCSAWRHIRDRYLEALLRTGPDGWTFDDLMGLPRCFLTCGVATFPPTEADLDDGLAEYAVDYADWYPHGLPLRGHLARASERWEGTHVAVFTDGACAHQDNVDIRRAGWGVHWGRDHPWNVASQLHGFAQSSDRAELQGLLFSWQQGADAGFPICTYLDNEYVVTGAQACLAGEPAPRSHPDLWQLVTRLIAAAPRGFFRVAWTKGHTTVEDVISGHIDFDTHCRNILADQLATAGRDLVAVSQDVIDAMRNRKLQCMLAQRMMLEIVNARRVRDQERREQARSEAVAQAALEAEEFAAAMDGGPDGPDGPPEDCEGAEAAAPVPTRAVPTLEAAQERFPDYAWRPPANASALRLLGGTPNSLIVSKRQWPYPMAWLQPLQWYWKALRWGQPLDDHRGITWIELVIDFEQSTRVQIRREDSPAALALDQRAHLFGRASRTLARILKVALWPGAMDGHCHSMLALGAPRAAGLRRRPALLQGAAVGRQCVALLDRRCTIEPLPKFWADTAYIGRRPPALWTGLEPAGIG